MENKVNYVNAILTLLAVLLGGVGAIWGANELFLRSEMKEEVAAEFTKSQYVKTSDVDNIVDKRYISNQAEELKKKDPSVSDIGSQYLNIPKEQVGHEIGTMLVYAKMKMQNDEDFQEFWDGQVNTINLIPYTASDGKRYFRDEDGSWLIRKVEVNGVMRSIYRGLDNKVRPVLCLDPIRTIVIE